MHKEIPMKKVAIIGTVGVPANYGGYETMVDNMLDFTPENIEYTVYCSKKSYKERPTKYKGANLKYIPLKANGPQALFYDALSIIDAYFKNDVIVTLGTAGSYVLPFLKMIKKKKIILNYDGYETIRDKWSSTTKRILSLLRRIASKQADIHIADNEAIAPLVKAQFGVDTVIIEYGGDGAFKVKNDEKLQKEYGLTPQNYYFNVARIEPENNIHVMLESFANLPEKQLVIVGNWGKSQYGIDLREKYKNFANIKMLDSIYEKNEINLLRSNCKLYIHPHSVGGTNPSLVEAMYLGLPIIAFDVIYNRMTTEQKAIYFKDEESLKDIVKRLSEVEMKKIAEEMEEIAKRRYLWKIIAKKYVELY